MSETMNQTEKTTTIDKIIQIIINGTYPNNSFATVNSNIIQLNYLKNTESSEHESYTQTFNTTISLLMDGMHSKFPFNEINDAIISVKKLNSFYGESIQQKDPHLNNE